MKKNLLARTLSMITAAIAFCSVNVMAQSTNGSWELVKSSPQVDVYKQVAQCTSADVQMTYWDLKFVNKTNATVTVKYQARYFYNGACATCSNDEYKYSFTVPASGSKIASCSGTNELTQQAVFIQYDNRPNGVTLESFEFGDFVVE